MAKSIIQADTKIYNRECFLCRFNAMMKNQYYEPSEDERKELELHHMIHGTANRELADKLGLWCYLCPEHHRTGKEAVHSKGGRENDIFLMQVA